MIEPSSVVAVILAAGLSRRFGEDDKLMADCRGQPLVTHAADLAVSLPFRWVLAVCRAEGDVGSLLHARGLTVHMNATPERGMGSSLAIGVEAASRLDPEACLILLGDMPDVTSAHVASLLAAFDTEHDVIVSSAEGRRMPPALFGHRHLPRLREIGGDHGARLLTQHGRVVDTAAAILKDVDEPADLHGASPRRGDDR